MGHYIYAPLQTVRFSDPSQVRMLRGHVFSLCNRRLFLVSFLEYRVPSNNSIK